MEEGRERVAVAGAPWWEDAGEGAGALPCWATGLEGTCWFEERF